MKDYEDDDFDYMDMDDYLLDHWAVCKFEEKDSKHRSCEDCEFYDDCLQDAEDNRGGYESFCDIVSDAYGSVDAFWECNGI